jgi:hypothetical protein
VRENIGINPDYDFLYDPQQAPSYGSCKRCGADIYAKGQVLCYDCREEQGTDEWWGDQWD